MASINPIELVEGMSGKICQHSNYYFSTNRQNGHIYTGKICFPSSKAPTERQIAMRQQFAQLVAQLKEWLQTNKPSETQPKGSALYQTTLAAYHQQHKIGRFNAYVIKHVLMPNAQSGGTGTNPSTGDDPNDIG